MFSSHPTGKKQNTFQRPKCHLIAFYPVVFVQISQHDDGLHLLLQHHHPELLYGVGERSLTCDVGVLIRVPVDEIRVDVVAAWHIRVNRAKTHASRVVSDMRIEKVNERRLRRSER